MKNLVHDPTGLIHLIAACLSMVFGTMVLAARKGTRVHKKIGYAYSFCMIVVIVTSFNLYHLFHRFGPFHYAAILSFVTLVTGLIPAIFFRDKKFWIAAHVPAMYYSVIGLYAAFASEVLTRIPGLPFFGLVFLATGIVMFIAVLAFRVRSKIWLSQR